MDQSLKALTNAISKSRVVDRRKHAEVVQQVHMLLTQVCALRTWAYIICAEDM